MLVLNSLNPSRGDRAVRIVDVGIKGMLFIFVTITHGQLHDSILLDYFHGADHLTV